RAELTQCHLSSLGTRVMESNCCNLSFTERWELSTSLSSLDQESWRVAVILASQRDGAHSVPSV
ncbi:hypothetical protein RRG08_064530, partial [Elysia crispata]